MLFEQITEFELRGPGPPGRTCTFITAYFHDKTKIFKENLRVDYYLVLFVLLPLIWAQARSQKFAIRGGCFGGLRAEPPALENFAFFCKNN